MRRRPPRLNRRIRATNPLPDGSKVLVIGGGIAGSAFTRQLFLLAEKESRDISVTLINSTNCNYCGGLVTNLALNTLRELYQLDIPDELVLKNIEECVFINRCGSTEVLVPDSLTATLRTSRFGLPGFDDSIKQRIMDGIPAQKTKLETIEPTIVRQILPPEKPGEKWRLVLSRRNPDKTFQEVAGDVVVVACGFRALNRPVLQHFQEVTGYVPPATMPASVTEVDTSKAKRNLIANKMFILDGIVPEAVCAFIPKGKNWLTLTSLNKRLSEEDLLVLFNHPEVKKYLDLPDPVKALRCHLICGASVYTGPAQNFYGDGWVVIGDLSGYGRVLKDGYFAAFYGARLAAETLIYHGASRKAFARYYHRPLKEFVMDNRVGMKLFYLNNFIGRQEWFGRLFIAASEWEREKTDYGSYLHAAIRALCTGELSYRLIGLLLIAGLMKFIVCRPGTTLKCLLRSNSEFSSRKGEKHGQSH
ncbi:putative geranylgeranyl reductase [Calderihabitans maritimus]|uniref:Putative geranylgeranyl reductase n=2 Tax=Calderihabitans maritimus TaxID=1246530 RepID=A0A1Z5HPJ9_9FIRM|nr:putative geranylgeranyl reductase [Calderihabitans maritimus]